MNSLKSGLNKLKGIFIDEDGQMTWITAVIGYGLCAVILISVIVNLNKSTKEIGSYFLSTREISRICLAAGYPKYIKMGEDAYCYKTENNSDVLMPIQEIE